MNKRREIAKRMPRHYKRLTLVLNQQKKKSNMLLHKNCRDKNQPQALLVVEKIITLK